MILRDAGFLRLPLFLLFISTVLASVGDRDPAFQECVSVCKKENCAVGSKATSIPLVHRLLLWDCPQECDYTCQHIITNQRVAASQPIVQYHGKWPFQRLWGVQEPLSVLFSLFNFLAHQDGLNKLRTNIPPKYTLRKYYCYLSYLGMASWTFSMIFHIRDFKSTEELDYFAAGASVLYGLYYAPIRIFRMDQGGRKTRSILRAWTVLCIVMFIAHVTYLKYFDWDYGYNMTANVVVGVTQNALWSWFSFNKYRKSKRTWAAWPGLVVAWLMLVMSLELLDFPPLYGYLDAHSLWHLGTVFPTILWYNFLVKDAQDDMAGQRLKA
ncbi:Per1-like protein [Coleophoma cylindrospora]|uniref:Post-GPI attachment to proteins factor 3 n=1 Tax=Coleophoma cylindrospora TaxID=1849047 RepID=A0A3D8SU41_9HELO|nr:Per1-like protein [Coleophoma cylindrospora]